MRGQDSNQQHFFSYVSPDARVPKDHPLRPIRRMVDQALKELWGLFSDTYSHTGRPSIAPEQLFRALVLQVLYTIRSERLLMEQLDYNLLFRWFVGLVHGRSGLGSFLVLQKPRPAAEHRDGPAFFQVHPDQAQAAGYCPTSTSAWMARCWRRGPR